MLKRFFIFTVLAGAAVAVIAGCDAEPEQQRSVVTVMSLNCNEPGVGDVLSDSGSVADTWAAAIFQNRPYDPASFTEPGDPYGDFLITGYQIDWVGINGGYALPPRQEATSFSIPSGEIGGANIRLVSLTEKLDPNVLAALPFTMLANITFVGHETGTTRDATVQASITVEFANYSPDPKLPSCGL